MEAGQDPVHAAYTTTLNLISTFAEAVTAMPPLHSAHDFIARAQEIYAPGFPPQSPITVSHFVTWTMFDVRFGPDHETIGDCFVAVADILQLGAVAAEAVAHLRQSRLGVYEVTAGTADRFRLRELVTNGVVDALIPTGFKGSPGQLILVRLVPPLLGATSYHVALTTPYLLLGCAEGEWLEYFARHQVMADTVGVGERLQRHLKYGRKPDYWSEYIFYGYVNHRSDAIFLTGFPDRPETQPQHRGFDPRSSSFLS